MFGSEHIKDSEPANSEARKLRGLEIASLATIEKVGSFCYSVPSVTNPRPVKYNVISDGANFACNCEDHQTHGDKCKHIYAVEYATRNEQKLAPKSETGKTVVTKTRKTYPQNWPAYNMAQTNEKRNFRTLLADLCRGVESPEYASKAVWMSEQSGRGRPAFPLSDLLFSVVYKVYSTFSGRRFVSDLCDVQTKGFINRVPHYNTMFRCMENPNLFPILVDLIKQSSLPLQSIETKFAVDSTGFAYSRFVRWYDIKYNRFTAKQQWVKAHICCGVRTNIVTAIEIREPDAGDVIQLPSLVKTTAENFTMAEVSADKGYSSRSSHDAINEVGAVPYIAFKHWTTGGVGGLFQKMFHYFQLNREDFLQHYHQRSNVESTVMMIKTKFGDAVRSKSEVAAKNEVLCKVLCHNICCLISAMYELGIDTPDFQKKLILPSLSSIATKST